MKAKSYNFNICFYLTVLPKLNSSPLLNHSSQMHFSPGISSAISDSTNHSFKSEIESPVVLSNRQNKHMFRIPYPHRKNVVWGGYISYFLKETFECIIYILEFSILCILYWGALVMRKTIY